MALRAGYCRRKRKGKTTGIETICHRGPFIIPQFYVDFWILYSTAAAAAILAEKRAV
jgi:hypothetical protein